MYDIYICIYIYIYIYLYIYTNIYNIYIFRVVCHYLLICDMYEKFHVQ